MQVSSQPAYLQSVNTVAEKLGSDIHTGLSQREASKRLRQFGPNLIDISQKYSWIQLLLQQFVSPLVGVLAIAALLAFSFQEWLEGIAILVVLIINALIGFFMEWQAVRSMNALKKLTQMTSSVFRQGKLIKVNASTLVPGDVIFLEPGDVVPADCRIAEQSNLKVKEAALTGESTAVSKQTRTLPREVSLADRSNLIFKGTVIIRGNVKAIITATGPKTELGKISHLVQEAQKAITPLEKKLNMLGQKLLWLTLILALFVLGVGILKGQDPYLMIKTAIALAIAAIPEGLPIVATIALAKGMLRLAQHNVIVKRLGAVETLGETHVIFTDKTGTLTENRLSVDTLVFEFGTVNTGTVNEALTNTFAFEQMIRVGALCNNASLNHQKSESDNPFFDPVGDPLEIALLQFAENQKVDIDKLRTEFPRIKELPFDSEIKMMGTLNKNGKRPDFLVCIKGALEVILKESDFILTKDGKVPLENKHKWLNLSDDLASKGLRILAFAYNEIDKPEDQFFHNLIFLGFIGFLDPPRAEVPKAIQTCKKAGIKVVMVTGDHPETARNIAFRTGLTEKEDALTLHGENLKPKANLSEHELDNILNTNIFARVSPVQKLDLITIYQNSNYIVGMTGDGINDTPALKKADIGIAMGNRGTEAAKEVADLILKDDSFTSIVTAVRQGRGIFQNIRYFVVYLLSCNLSEVLIVALASLSNLSAPLLPLQILFLNMVTDVFPALALGMNKESDKVMQYPPRNTREPILTRKMWYTIILYSLSMTIAVLGILLYGIYCLNASATLANNLAFYTLILVQLWNVFNLPDARASFWNNEITRNIFVWLAILVCLLIALIAYEVPILKTVLSLQAISSQEVGIVVLFSLIPVALIQIFKRISMPFGSN